MTEPGSAFAELNAHRSSHGSLEGAGLQVPALLVSEVRFTLYTCPMTACAGIATSAVDPPRPKTAIGKSRRTLRAMDMSSPPRCQPSGAESRSARTCRQRRSTKQRSPSGYEGFDQPGLGPVDAAISRGT